MIEHVQVFPYPRPGAPEGFMLRIEERHGVHGWGDAAPWPGFGDWRRAGELEQALRTGDPAGPVEARHAWELARLDQRARLEGRPMSALLVERPAAQVPVHTLVRDAEEAVRAVAAGATHLKIKVGRLPLEEEDARVWSIRASVGDAPRLRLDANGAWTRDHAHTTIERLRRWDIEWFEQPLPPGDVEGMAHLRRTLGVALAADESVTCIAALEALAAAQALDVAVIKPMFVGGPQRAAELAHRARELGIDAVITHAFGSPVDRAAAVHVAATLGNPTRPCGVGTPPHGAFVPVPTDPGLGEGVSP